MLRINCTAILFFQLKSWYAKFQSDGWGTVLVGKEWWAPKNSSTCYWHLLSCFPLMSVLISCFQVLRKLLSLHHTVLGVFSMLQPTLLCFFIHTLSCFHILLEPCLMFLDHIRQIEIHSCSRDDVELYDDFWLVAC